MQTELKIEDCINKYCPWSGAVVSGDSLSFYKGYTVGFCNPACRDKFQSAITHFDQCVKEQTTKKTEQNL